MTIQAREVLADIGIVGGGQLGRMTIPPALSMNLRVSFLDADSTPCHGWAPFITGDITKADDIFLFGNSKEVIGYEREDIAAEGLERLIELGKIVRPDPTILRLLQDKRKQKKFFCQHHYPAAKLIANSYSEWQRNPVLPVVEKIATGGYDGRGVQILRSTENAKSTPSHEENLPMGKDLDDNAVFYEEFFASPRELAILVARDQNGKMAVYDPVEMFFCPKSNVLDYYLVPANVAAKHISTMRELARDLSEQLHLCGILTIEFFLTRDDRLVINEIAGRPHNSAHHTIDCAASSQFEQWLRCLSNLPLGETELIGPSMCINILGPDFPVSYQDSWQPIFLLEKAKWREKKWAANNWSQRIGKVHMYGKNILPNRKIGHINVTGASHNDLKAKREWIRKNLA